MRGGIVCSLEWARLEFREDLIDNFHPSGGGVIRLGGGSRRHAS
jgi:hypothetical protein